MKDDLYSIDYTEIEKRARVLRAEAVRDGFASFRSVLANAFSALSLRGSKTA